MPNNSGAISGAAQGAATGAAIGSVVPVIGTAVGAVVGGVIGAIGGAFSDKSSRYARRADKMREEAALIQSFLDRRALIQQYQIARSSTIAGGLAAGAGLESSAIQGSTGSVQAQTQSVLGYNAAQIAHERKAANWYRKAGKADANANMTQGLLQAGASIAGSFGGGAGGYSASAQRAGIGSYVGTSRPVYSGGGVPGLPYPTTVNTSPFTRG